MIITLKDGSTKEYAEAMSAYDIARDISDGLARAACLAEIDGEAADLRTIIDKDCQLNILTFDSDEGKPMNECVVNELYLPVKNDVEQDIFALDFPLTITMDELVAAAGEPNNDVTHYEDGDYYSDTYKYSIESTRYYGGSSYEFEYVKGELRYLYITWMP